MKILQKYPLLFPGVLVTSTSHSNLLTSVDIRLEETRRSIINAINIDAFQRIVIVDGSNMEIFSSKEIEEFAFRGVEIEQMSFMQNRDEVYKYGKSNGECQLVEFAVNNSNLINTSNGFFKMSPRYTMTNLVEILPFLTFDNIFFDYNIWPFTIRSPFVNTIFYKTSIDFYKHTLINARKLCSHQVDGYLESVFFQLLKNKKSSALRSPFPYFTGIAGTTGQKIFNSKYKIRNIFSLNGFLAKGYH